MTYINVRFPLELDAVASDATSGRIGGFKAVVTVLFLKAKSKVHVTFAFDAGVIASWPMSIRRVQCSAETIYGSIE